MILQCDFQAIRELIFMDFWFQMRPLWGLIFKKMGLKFDVKIDDFLDGSDEHDAGGLRPRQGILLPR